MDDGALDACACGVVIGVWLGACLGPAKPQRPAASRSTRHRARLSRTQSRRLARSAQCVASPRRRRAAREGGNRLARFFHGGILRLSLPLLHGVAAVGERPCSLAPRCASCVQGNAAFNSWRTGVGGRARLDRGDAPRAILAIPPSADEFSRRSHLTTHRSAGAPNRH